MKPLNFIVTADMRMLVTTIAVSALLAVTVPAPAHAVPDYLDVKAKSLRVEYQNVPLLTVEEGQPVTLHCDYQIGVAETGSTWKAGGKAHVFPVRILIDNNIVGNFEGKLGPETKITGTLGSLGSLSSFYGKTFPLELTSPPLIWVAKVPGDHQAVCTVNVPKAISDRDPGNNTTKPVTIRVTPKKAVVLPLLPTTTPPAQKPATPLAAGQPAGPVQAPVTAEPKQPAPAASGGFAPSMAKPAPGVIAAIAKPNLSVTGVVVKIEPNCQSPQPAMTVAATIKNDGGALSAGKGYVYVKETGGANLSSGGIPLPAIGAGQTQTVNIPAMTLQPYSSLAGVHQVQVLFTPQQSGGQLSFNHPAAPHVFSAIFPPGHCQPAQRQPPGASGSQPGTQAPAVQQSPGPPGVQMNPGPPSQPQRR